MCACLCMFVCALRLVITSGVMWCDIDPTWLVKRSFTASLWHLC